MGAEDSIRWVDFPAFLVPLAISDCGEGVLLKTEMTHEPELCVFFF